jgi:hypothetical protein
MILRRYILILLLSVSLLLYACGKTGPRIAVEPLPQYDALFSNSEGWTGGDGVYSVALNTRTFAWFFGDTWIDRVKGDRHHEATLVNNSMAIQQGTAAATAEMRFFFSRDANGQPAAFIRPNDGRGWFWIFDGVTTPEGLYIFLIQIDRTSGDTVFGFQVVGTWLGHVSNPGESPLSWRITQSKVPGSTFSTAGGILWGSAIVPIDDFLYIYGTVEEVNGNVARKHMILARAPASSLADFSTWRFYADGNWVMDYRRVSRLSADMPHEYSVTYLPALKQYAAVYSEDGLSKNILLRLSPAPEGSWGEPIQIFQCPEAEWDESIFCYAAKAHADLSRRPDRLIITYIANSVDFDRVANDVRLYRPRFLQLNF